jgi:CBS domain containing-hemolysin-like protein
MSDPVALLLAVALLAGNAFFVGAEFALIAARRTQIEPLALGGSRRARITLRAMEQVSLMMAGAQLGITVCSLGLGAVGEPAVAHLLEGPLAAAGVPGALLHPIALVIALTIVVFLHMVLGEMVPKNIAIAGPERSALLLGPPLFAVVRLFRPFLVGLNLCANGVLRLLRVEPKEEVASTFTAQEVAGLVEESRREGLLDDEEHQLLTGALDFVERTAQMVVLPLSSLVTLPREASAGDLQDLCARTGFSRFPVVGADGDVVAYVHAKDVLDVPAERCHEPLPGSRLRPLATVLEGDPLREVLAQMQARGSHLARVLDPTTRRTVGVVALEDVIEELVGEVSGLASSGLGPTGEDRPTRGR